ncbi:MAG TPA: carboxypeptidase-like regulatory domain-containing protein, partial [Longimicrobium sp.]|nr:carboxypeptidase-like regulatory domain-containing protein [Longimicrobium sp.]
MLDTPRRIRPLLALIAAAACIPAAASAQNETTSTVRVVVRAQEGGAAVRDARVELLGARAAGNSDAEGVVRLAGVPSGPAIVSIHKIGYGDERFTLNLPAGDTVTVEVDLQPAAVRLAEVRATALRSRVLSESGFF